MRQMHGAQLATLCSTLTLALSGCSSGSSDGALDAGGSGGGGGSHNPGSGGAGGSAAHDAGTAGSHAGSGGTSVQVDAGGVVCGTTHCPAGYMCCPGCNPGEESCGTACTGFQCPVQPVGVPCGTKTCAVGLSCCDHCTGSCVSSLSGASCPDDQDPKHACDDAGTGMCAQTSASCLTLPCCAGLTCCSGVPIPPGEARCSGSVGGCPISDYHLKAGFSAVESDAVLQGLLALPLSRWHYKSEPADVQHIGPMAQDFKETFGVGADDKHIFQVDADGVSYAAIQALARRIEKLTAAQAALARDNVALREQVKRLETRARSR